MVFVSKTIDTLKVGQQRFFWIKTVRNILERHDSLKGASYIIYEQKSLLPLSSKVDVLNFEFAVIIHFVGQFVENNRN